MPAAETNLDTPVFSPSAGLNTADAAFSRIEAKSSLRAELETMLGKPVQFEFDTQNRTFGSGILVDVLQHEQNLTLKVAVLDRENRSPTGKTALVNYSAIREMCEIELPQIAT